VVTSRRILEVQIPAPHGQRTCIHHHFRLQRFQSIAPGSIEERFKPLPPSLWVRLMRQRGTAPTDRQGQPPAKLPKQVQSSSELTNYEVQSREMRDWPLIMFCSNVFPGPSPRTFFFFATFLLCLQHVRVKRIMELLRLGLHKRQPDCRYHRSVNKVRQLGSGGVRYSG
jgi:hypothetical protein